MLPNLLNVAQIVNIIGNHTLAGHESTVDSGNGSFDHESEFLPPDHPECAKIDITRHSQQILKNMLNEHYDAQLVPDSKGVLVSVELALQTFYDISEISASFTADVLLSQIWHDYRLRFDHHTRCIQNLSLSYAITNKIWQPFVNFVNSKKSELHSSPTPNTFVLIYPNGTIWVNYRLRVEGPCFMDRSFRHYPMDVQTCGLVLESYAYNTAKVRLKWRDWDPVFSYSSSTVLPDYMLSEIYWDKNTFIYAAGQWDQLSVNFVLTRQFAFHIIQIYLPLQTSIFISWISFYLDSRALPARITLGVSAMMALSFQYGAIVKTLPRVSYIKAVDIWVFASVGYVFLSLIETAIVGFLERQRRLAMRKYSRKSKLSRSTSSFDMDGFANFETHYTNSNGYNCETMMTQTPSQEDATQKLISEMEEMPNVRANPFRKSLPLKTRVLETKLKIRRWKSKWCDPEELDRASRQYFPLSFCIFNFVYWTYYLGWIKLVKPYWEKPQTSFITFD
uniref:Neur_chan_LBD domain-containing protein n=1 Tax=Panagrellus redivivus TaxID=6233 RepID=A0A7E4VM37_PANRE